MFRSRSAAHDGSIIIHGQFLWKYQFRVLYSYLRRRVPPWVAGFPSRATIAGKKHHAQNDFPHCNARSLG